MAAHFRCNECVTLPKRFSFAGGHAVERGHARPPTCSNPLQSNFLNSYRDRLRVALADRVERLRLAEGQRPSCKTAAQLRPGELGVDSCGSAIECPDASEGAVMELPTWTWGGICLRADSYATIQRISHRTAPRVATRRRDPIGHLTSPLAPAAAACPVGTILELVCDDSCSDPSARSA